MNSFRRDLAVLRDDSMKLIMEGMLFGPWIHAKTRNSFTLELKELMSPSFRWVFAAL